MSRVVRTHWLAALAGMALLGGCSTATATGHATAPTAGAAGPLDRTAVGAVTAAPTITRLRHWGSFFGGTPGNVDTLRAPVPVTLPGIVAEVGSSNSTEYALLADGRLYAWGLGTQGQLGDGRRANSLSRPVQVRFPAGVRIASIPTDAMPFDTGLAVDTGGHVWGWGNNGGGELCLGSTRSYARPVRLPLSDVTAVAGASTHAVYDAHGTVYACGQNLGGDLGTGNTRNTTTPEKVAGLPGGVVTRLVASFANSGALLADGRYYDWGYDRAGQLGDAKLSRSSNVPVLVLLPHPVVRLAEGGSLWNNGQTLALLSNGSVWAWGNDHAGQLGNGTLRAAPAPVRSHLPAGARIVALATGSATSYALTTAGQVYAWGVSHEGQLGDGYTTAARVPVLVAAHATAISATANNVVIGAAATRR